MLDQVCQVAQLHQGQGVAAVESLRAGAKPCSSLLPSLSRRMLPAPCMAQAQAHPTHHPQPSRGKQAMIFTCDLYFLSHFFYFVFSFFFFSSCAVPGSCWQQQQLCFDELINISPRSQGAPACSASPCFTSD